ncbi:MAG: DCC1-like thiol-disulfide oxidoreductase family protein [Acidimicrobiales bacterium]
MGDPATIVFDGECAACRALAAWARKRLPADVELVDARTWHQRSAYPSAAELDASVWWLEGDRHWSGAAAVVRSLRALGGPWRTLGAVADLRALRPAAESAYRFAARHRCARGCGAHGAAGVRRTMSPWST